MRTHNNEMPVYSEMPLHKPIITFPSFTLQNLSIIQENHLPFSFLTVFRYFDKQFGTDITQEQLANEIGVTKNRISNWEQGINRPDVEIVGNICRALNVSPSDLLDVHLSDEVLTEHEKKVINAYREKSKFKMPLIFYSV